LLDELYNLAVPQLAAGDHFQFGLAAQFSITANKRGTIEFDTPAGGRISVLGLRFTPPNNALTTIPALANVGTGGGSIAHLASGGDGWQTTFVLVNTGTSAAQAGIASDDPSFTLKCPNCGLSTQYHLAKLNEQLKDRQDIDFFCAAVPRTISQVGCENLG
jgi:hypothetical protein